jgi:hypothetical protein
MVLAGCGGSASMPAAVQSRQLGQGGAVGQTGGATVDTAAFIKLAQSATTCSEAKNRLWLIDGKEVFWDRASSKCPDMNWSQALYGATPQAQLCSAADSIAGPVTTCANDTVRALFDTITKSSESPTLGLDASHTVEAIPFLPANGTDIAFETVDKELISGIKDARNVVVKDQASWDALWKAHTANNSTAALAPSVDFARQMVIGVFAGENRLPCGQVGIVHIGPANGKLVVDYEERTWAAPPVCAAVLTQPMQLVVVARTDAAVEFVAHGVALLPSLALDGSKSSGVRTSRNVVLKDQQAWAALWAEHAGADRAVPAVDFGRQEVIGVFMGEFANPCTDLRIDSLTTDQSKITVRYVLVPPRMGVMCTMNTGRLAQIVAIDRSDLPVVFVQDSLRPGSL